jgi:hypothetical protein
MGSLSLADALSLCELLAKTDPARYERAALRWLRRFIDERWRSQRQRSPSFGTATETLALRRSSACSIVASSACHSPARVRKRSDG